MSAKEECSYKVNILVLSIVAGMFLSIGYVLRLHLEPEFNELKLKHAEIAILKERQHVTEKMDKIIADAKLHDIDYLKRLFPESTASSKCNDYTGSNGSTKSLKTDSNASNNKYNINPTRFEENSSDGFKTPLYFREDVLP